MPVDGVAGDFSGRVEVYELKLFKGEQNVSALLSTADACERNK